MGSLKKILKNSKAMLQKNVDNITLGENIEWGNVYERNHILWHGSECVFPVSKKT